VSWPEPPDWLQLEVEPRRLARGGTITATLEAPADELATHARELGLGCLAHHASRHKTGEFGDAGGRFRIDRQALVYADWRPVTGPQVVEFTVPEDAPYSYEGDVVSFYWAVWLRAELRVVDREAYALVWVDP
jgi:hypothetical protein